MDEELLNPSSAEPANIAIHWAAEARLLASSEADQLLRYDLAQPAVGRVVTAGLMPDHVDWHRRQFERKR